MILAGDIGGTKTDLALFTPALDLVVRRTFPSREHASLEDIVRQFLAEMPAPFDSACFGIAGPVRAGRVLTTNLPWTVTDEALAEVLRLREVRLINDLEATALGVGALRPEHLLTLQAGSPQGPGHQAVIAAGTGLGEAGLFWNGDQHVPYASEGGHASFAPRDARQRELLAWLEGEFGHVSYERVLSGPGLFNIYRFLRDTGRGTEPVWLADELRQGDPPAVVSRAALAGTCDLAREALTLFVTLYGAEAGNLALKAYATGGVFVAGGIARKIRSAIENGAFVAAFVDKGRMEPLLRSIPVRLVLSDAVNLLGAARGARPTPAREVES